MTVAAVGVLAAQADAARAAPSAAGQDRVDLAWRAPSECPSRAEVVVELEARIPASARVAATADVSRTPNGYRVSVVVEGGGERTIEATSCREIAASTALVLVMSATPADAARRDASSASSASASLPASPSAPRERGDGERARLLGRVEGALDVGTLPSAAPGIGLSLGIVATSRLELEVFGRFYGSQEGTSSVDASRGAAFSYLAGGARACLALTRTVVVAPCVGAIVSRVDATGFGVLKPGAATAVTGGPELLATVRVPLLRGASLRVGIGVVAPISRQSFVITSLGAVHRPSAVDLAAFAGPELSF